MFYGYQRQPELRTVEGEMISACVRAGIFRTPMDAHFQSASRTDRGVHAVSNAVAFDTSFSKEEIIPALNALCEDIYFHSMLEVPSSFNPRRARMRHYRYFLFDPPDRNRLSDALEAFVGERDFSNFSKGGSQGRIRRIERITMTECEGCIAVDFAGRSFLHNMIRRIMSAALMVASGKVERVDVQEALSGKRRSFGLAPPEYLILMDVDYGMRFESYAFRKAEHLLRERMVQARIRETLFSYIMDEFRKDSEYGRIHHKNTSEC